MADKSKSLAAFQAFIETDECPDEITQDISAALHFGFEYASKRTDQEKAAPDMYEALKEWSALDEVMKECGFCADEYLECDIHQGQLQQIIKMREAALLKAEGREV